MQGVKGAKMNWKNRLTNYNFWISIVSAVLLILQAFEFQFDIMYINEIATAVLGLLVVIGIINDPTKNAAKKETKTEKVEKTENAEAEKVENNIAEIKAEETPVEEKELAGKLANENIESVEEQTFPIDEEDEIIDDIDENDIKNLVDVALAEELNENNNFKEMFKNLLNLLNNNEKTSKISENLENSSEKTENLNNVNVEKFEEIKPEILTETIVEKEVVEEIANKKVEEVCENIELQNNENIKEDKIQQEEIKTENSIENNVQPVAETEVQASSFNIVN